MSSDRSAAPDTSVLEHELAQEQDEWQDEGSQLPRRPRRRVLAPVPLALLAVLLVACGFIGGVLVQKNQGGSAATGGRAAGGGAGFASRLAALRGAGSPAGAAGNSTARGAPSPFSASAAGAGVTTGEVAYVRGDTLYVTDGEGNTVKVEAAAGSKVTKTVATSAASIHPGATVVVLGSKDKSGTVSASSISVGSGSAVAGFSAGASSGAGVPKLFGPG